MNTFYRVCNPETQQGLWYNFDGSFTGLIHDKFSFCENSQLRMDFDPDLVGYLSAVRSLDELYKWFTKEDIIKLQEHGWYTHEYSVTHSKFYERFQHDVICQSSSILKQKHILNYENIHTTNNPITTRIHLLH